ncbi:MAG: hypothetical protein ACI9G9_000161 [Psychromonas sp.]|jgi:hypothetical protein
MKPIYLSIIFSLGLLLSASLVGCKKYDFNAKFIELKTVKSRLCGREWVLENNFVDFYYKASLGGSYEVKNFKLNFSKSGRFTFSNEKTHSDSEFFKDGLKGGGNWSFDQDKEIINLDFGSRIMTFEIDVLNKKQFWVTGIPTDAARGEGGRFTGFKR